MKTEEKEKAIQLRSQGLSYKEILKVVNVSKGTISVWCKDIKLDDKQIQRLKEKCKTNSILNGRRNKEKWEKLRKDLWDSYNPPIDNPKFMLGIGLYWGEGSKYSKCTTSLANSDPKLLKTFIWWLKEFFPDDFTEFSITIQHYGNDEEIKNYWSKELQIELQKFNKSNINKISKSSKLKRKTLPYGTAKIICKGKNNWKIRQKIEKTLTLLSEK